MIYVKSVLTGLAAVIVAEILVAIGGISALLVIASRQPHESDGGLGWDPVAFARTLPGWLILVLAFVAGFWWQYRRLASR